jgi:hypothetical protein
MFLSRESFKEKVFERDGHKCVVCGDKAVDAHHLIDRSLWDDGGYYLDNGVSLCADHHIEAETTAISCTELREKAGIGHTLMPDHFYLDEEYDHWGNIVKPSGARVAGELYYKESVRKTIQESGNLEKFLPYVKFPRTYHFPWSPGLQNDDKVLKSLSYLEGQEVVATLKMDGENCSIYKDYIHARSVDSKHHKSREWVKGLQGKIGYEIPEGFRICGENLYAEHSIHYDNLKDYFLVFSVWNEYNTCLSWDETEEWAQLLGLNTVPVLYKGPFDREAIENAFKDYSNSSPDEVEGYVVRVRDSFSYGEYRHKVGKFVRPHHVQTDEHWMNKPVVKNGLDTL